MGHVSREKAKLLNRLRRLRGQIEAIERQGAALQLSVNFRTVPRITNEVNALFEPLMTGPVSTRCTTSTRRHTCCR